MMEFKINIKDYLYMGDEIIIAYLQRGLRNLERVPDKPGFIDCGKLQDLTIVGNYKYKNFRGTKENKSQEILDTYREEVYYTILDEAGVKKIKFLTIIELREAVDKLYDYIDQKLNLEENITFPSLNKMKYGETIYRENLTKEIKFAKLCIAAVPSLFTAQAWARSNDRIEGNQRELSSFGKVELDPIFMLKNREGYIIITAWGDEANDELIANHNSN